MTCAPAPLGGRWPPSKPRRTSLPYDLNDPALIRVAARPLPDDWKVDEPVTLLEGAALLFPMGPIGVSTLRRARKQGKLAISKVGNRHMTTIAAMRAMTEPKIMADPEPATAPTLPRNHPRTPEQTDLLAELDRRRALGHRGRT